MKTRLAATVVATVLAGAPVVSAARADAAEGCVLRADWRQVQKGWTQQRVHRVLGATGARTILSTSGGRTVEVRAYESCLKPDSVLTIGYERKPGTKYLKVTNKQTVWVG